MKHIKIVMESFFAAAFGCFLTQGATNDDLIAPAVVVFVAWLTLFIMMLFDNE